MSESTRRTPHDALRHLATRAKQGDRQALEELLAAAIVKKTIYNVAVPMVGENDAEDIYQDVCLRIARSIQGWGERGQVTTWIRKITVCRCLDIQEKRKKEAEKRNQSAIVSDLTSEQLSSQHLSVVKKERAEILREALQQMGEPCSRMLSLYIFEGLEKKEILTQADFQKSKFYTLWKSCWGRLTKNVTHILKKGRKDRSEDQSF